MFDLLALLPIPFPKAAKSPAKAKDVVTLKVNGRAWDGWKEVKITRSLKAVASGFSLSVSDTAPQTPGETWVAGPGAKAVIEIDGETVVVGYVDSVSASLSATDRTVTVEGREKTGDIVDCCIERHSFLNATIEGVARAACAPYGVEVRNDSGVLKRYPNVAIANGETVFAVLDKLARRDAVLLNSDGKGRLIIAKIGGETISGALEEGKNLLSVSATFDNKGRFSQYVVKGQHGLGDMDPALMASPTGRARDKGIDRTRVLTFNLETSGTREDAQRRANWELTTRQAKAVDVSAKVHGWRDPSGALWAPNKLISVKAPSVAIDAQLLITDVSFSQSISGGTVTDLKLTRKDAYKPEPAKPDQADLYKKMIDANKKGAK